MATVTERMQGMVREHITNPPRDGDLRCMLDPRNPIVFFSPGLRSFLAGVEPGHGFARKPEPIKPILTAVEVVELVGAHLKTLRGTGLSLGEEVDIARQMHRDLRERYSVVKTPITREQANQMVDERMGAGDRALLAAGFELRTTTSAHPAVEQAKQELRKDILEQDIMGFHVIVG